MPYADLVLEGGGVKGIGLVGAITVLMEHGYEFNRIAGTSAGSIVGALVAAGFTRDELERTLREVDYRSFMDGPLWNRLGAGRLFELVVGHGIFTGDRLKAWLGEQLASHGVHTFADLRYEDTGGAPADPDRAYRLVANVSDITAGCLRQLPWDYRQHYHLNADDRPVAEAVRCSMSIPFFYKPAILTDGDGSDHWIVDGGMLSNFPISLFDTPAEVTPRWPTFGIKLSSKPDAVKRATAHKVRGTASMSMAMLDTLVGFYDRMHVENPAVIDRTIFVDTADVKGTDFDLTPAQRDLLYANGRAAATKFLEGSTDRPAWDWERYKSTYRVPVRHPVPSG